MKCVRRFRSTFCLLALLALPSIAFAQDAPPAPPDQETNMPPIPLNLTWAQALEQAASSFITAAPTNIAVVPYATYAPDAPTKFGGGVMALYNLSQYLGAGVGLDYLGSFTLVAADVELQLPTHPLSPLGLTNFLFTPFTLGGVGTPIGGAGSANGGLSTAVVVGGAFDPWTLFNAKSPDILGGKIAVGGAYGNRFNAGDYSGKFFNFFIGWRKDF
jgi:hypothetical protein